MTTESDLTQQLKSKQICRFCLAVDETLSDIFSNENRMTNRAPLPLQIMSSVSLEVNCHRASVIGVYLILPSVYIRNFRFSKTTECPAPFAIRVDY